jgi:P2 family phage contractile tail tube protein
VGQLTPLTIRGAVISDDGTQTAVVVNLQGIVREMDPGNWKPGEKATLKVMLALRYYKLTHVVTLFMKLISPTWFAPLVVSISYLRFVPR